MKIVVLGGGLVGGPMALDLAKGNDLDVTVVDIHQETLARIQLQDPRISVLNADLSSPARVSEVVLGFDLVLSAVPGFMGFETLKAVIEAGKRVVDIAFFSENPFDLDALAKEKGVVAVVDCGVSPGMSNVLIGNADHLMDRTESVLIYVGGLPEVRKWPFEYKAVFSPIDVIEEYVRPARYIENGHLVVRPALSDAEYMDFPELGTLEAFNTDGLRSLADTIDAPNLKEKTLRYPGHIEKMVMLRDTGFFDAEPMDVGGVRVSPLEVTAKLLFKEWEMAPGEVDITVLKVIIEGEKDGSPVQYTYEMLDRYDEATGVHSMARTTGYTATLTARLLARGLYTVPGITPPEFLGRHRECVDFLLDGLRERGVVYTETMG
jgi:saccharopine dehydrogenase-like NADP-dependent oxidoreductase